MKAKVYCLHPGKIWYEDFVKDDEGKKTDKKMSGWKYLRESDLARLYGVDEKDCVTWGPECVGVEHLIHLKPDPKGIYELPRAIRFQEDKKQTDKKSISNLGRTKSKKQS